MSDIMDAFNKLLAVQKAIDVKKKEIDKRREVLETVSSTYVSKKKDEAKIEAIDSKISLKVAGIDKTIDYYKSELEKAEQKLQDDIEILKKKHETEVQKLENKFSLYRQYCHDAMKQQQEKRDLITEPLEKKKEMLQQTQEKSEDDDKILVRLKVELKQLLDEEVEKNNFYLRVVKEEEIKTERRRQNQIAEEQHLLRRLELEAERKREQERMILASQRAAEKAADEERWARQKEERIKTFEEVTAKTIEQEKAKQERQTIRERFLSSVYPLLSDKAARIYDFFKNSTDDEIYKEAMKKETLDDCEKYLLKHEETVNLVTDFETNQYPKLMKEKQDVYDNKTLWEQLRFIKQIKKKAENV